MLSYQLRFPNPKYVIGLALLCLALLTTSCSTVQTKTKIVKEYPAAVLIQDTPAPTWDAKVPKSNEYLLRYTLGTLDALDSCNADKAALRLWSSGVSK